MDEIDHEPPDKETPVTAVSDALLLRRFHEQGDIASFEALFERHYDMVYGVLFRLTGSRAEAEDLAQEVFVRLYERPLRHGENVAGWLYRVALNTGYNALRAARRRVRREQGASRQNVSGGEAVRGPEEQASRHEARDAVREALARIDPRAARLLILHEMGFSYREMAEIVGVAPGSVGTLLARARRSFEKAYAARAAEQPGVEGEQGDETT